MDVDTTSDSTNDEDVFRQDGSHRNKCQTCGKCFHRFDYLLKHQMVHSNSRCIQVRSAFKCSICGQDYSHAASLRRHEKVMHKIFEPRRKVKQVMGKRRKVYVVSGPPYACPICRKHFQRKSYLRYHIKRHNKSFCLTKSPRMKVNTSKVKPSILKEEFTTKKKISEEPKDVSVTQDVIVYLCKMCSSLVKVDEREQHVRNCHSNTNEHSESWNACFGGVNQSILHVKAYPQKNRCKTVERARTNEFTTAGATNGSAHLELCNKYTIAQLPSEIDNCSTELICSLCTRSFATINNLDQHRRLCHKTNIRLEQEIEAVDKQKQSTVSSFPLPSCAATKKFDSAACSADEVDIGITNPFKCAICSLYFKGATGLQVHHRKVHTRKRKYNAVKRTKLTSNCKLHECNKCSLKFYFPSHLKRHIKQHFSIQQESYEKLQPKSPNPKSNIVDIKLSLTSTPLEAKNELLDSACISRSINRFKCEGCEKVFGTIRGAKQHMNIHKELFRCNKCEKCFICTSYLRRHYCMSKLPTNEDLRSCCSDVEQISIATNDGNCEDTNAANVARWMITCDFCGTVCENQEVVKQHMLEQHVGGFCAFLCGACEFVSPNQRRMIEHCRNVHRNCKLLKRNTPNEEQQLMLQMVRDKLLAKNIV